MQKRFFSTEFFIILLFFVMPPIIFPQTTGDEYVMEIPYTVFILAALSFCLWWQIKAEKNIQTPSQTSRLRVLMNQGHCLVTFGTLLVTAGGIELICRLSPVTQNKPHLLPPETFSGWLNVIFGTLCAAFYEEVLYRVYLPDAMKRIFVHRKGGSSFQSEVPQTTKKDLRSFALESAAVILFALAHRYVGWISVLNALIAGTVLRRCYIKTASLLSCFIAHTLYNFVMLLATLA